MFDRRPTAGSLLTATQKAGPKVVIAAIVSALAIGVVGCGPDEVATSPSTKQLSTWEVIDQVNARGKITDAQAESLSKIELLDISEALQPLIDKYEKQ